MNYFELEASETPLHKIGTDVIGRCWIWIWTWMALWNSICTFILGRGRHSCTTGCSHIFILNSCSSCVACYSLASKLFCALALQKHTADTWQVHLGCGSKVTYLFKLWANVGVAAKISRDVFRTPDSRQVRYPDSPEALAERLYKDWHCAGPKIIRNLQDLGPIVSRT